MPRRRASQTSTSSEQSTGSEPSENLNLTEEFPDAGLPKPRDKGGKKKKNVSFTSESVAKNNQINVDITEAPNIASTSDVVVTEQPTKKSADEHVYDLTEEAFKPIAPSKGKKNLTKSKKAPEVKKLINLKRIDEKDVKAPPNEINKMYKVADSVKQSVNIEVHPALFSAWYMCEVCAAAAAAGARVVPAHDIADPSALLYTQYVSRHLAPDTATGQIRLTPGKMQCARSLYVVVGSEAARHVRARTLTDFMRRKRELIGGKLTLLILDHNHTFQKASKRAHKGTSDDVNEVDLEMAITDVLVGLKIETILVHTPRELAAIIVHYARAIAEESLKRSKREVDEQAEFYMRGDNKNCVSVDKDGNGLSRLWQQMIAILPMSSLEISRSLTAEYKSPRALAHELSSSEGEGRVAEVCVSRAAGGGARPRRLGPEATRRLRVLLTADDGNTLID